MSSTTGTQRRLRLVISQPRSAAIATAFAVRFTPRAGFWSWLRRSANSFGWVGQGMVRIDGQGAHFFARRLTLLGLRRVQRLIRAYEIHDVYREERAVQINLRGAVQRAFVRFWAADAATAAQLVACLPTSRTIELEEAAQATARTGRSPRLLVLPLAVAALVVCLSLLILNWGHLPPAAPPAPAQQAGAPRAQPAVAGPTDADVLAARADLGKFLARCDALTMQFGTAFDTLLTSNLSQQEFADGLERWQLPQWRNLAHQLPIAPATPLHARAAAELQAVITGWERALTLYVHGLRAQDPREVDSAFEAMRTAEQHEGMARQLLNDLERGRSDVAAAAAATHSAQ